MKDVVIIPSEYLLETARAGAHCLQKGEARAFEELLRLSRKDGGKRFFLHNAYARDGMLYATNGCVLLRKELPLKPGFYDVNRSSIEFLGTDEDKFGVFPDCEKVIHPSIQIKPDEKPETKLEVVFAEDWHALARMNKTIMGYAEAESEKKLQDFQTVIWRGKSAEDYYLTFTSLFNGDLIPSQDKSAKAFRAHGKFNYKGKYDAKFMEVVLDFFNDQKVICVRQEELKNENPLHIYHEGSRDLAIVMPMRIGE